jgi:ribosomal protein S21
MKAVAFLFFCSVVGVVLRFRFKRKTQKQQHLRRMHSWETRLQLLKKRKRERCRKLDAYDFRLYNLEDIF